MYRGPAPPPGKPSSYRFLFFALDLAVDDQLGVPTPGHTERLQMAPPQVVGRGDRVATHEHQ
jgi:phosphatidylethanolamine-binding protein (PEBP) family uncharacterized protein